MFENMMYEETKSRLTDANPVQVASQFGSDGHQFGETSRVVTLTGQFLDEMSEIWLSTLL